MQVLYRAFFLSGQYFGNCCLSQKSFVFLTGQTTDRPCKTATFVQNSTMQYVIDIKQEADLQLLLAFFERMQVSYRPLNLPKKKPVKEENGLNFSPKNEKDNSIENLLLQLGQFTDAEFADNIEAGQAN